MTKDEKKQLKTWLWSYQNCMSDIDSAVREATEWRGRAEKMTTMISDMPKGTSGLKLDDIVVEMLSVFGDIDLKTRQAKTAKEELETAFNALEPQTLGEVMKRRYINGMSWREIAIVMGYSHKHVLKLHGQALKKVKVDTK